MRQEPDRYTLVETLVLDGATQRQLAFLPGAVCLPIGSVIELADPEREAVVIGVRLLTGPGSVATVLLLVNDPAAEAAAARDAVEQLLEDTS